MPVRTAGQRGLNGVNVFRQQRLQLKSWRKKEERDIRGENGWISLIWKKLCFWTDTFS